MEILLGKNVSYKDKYDKSLLFPIARSKKRAEIGIVDTKIFYGYDLWNCYEVSWLAPNNKPQVRILEIIYDASSPFIIESKSLKLYLNSFNNTNFSSEENVISLITQDLSEVLETKVLVKSKLLDILSYLSLPSGFCLDNLNTQIDNLAEVRPDFLQLTGEDEIEETLYSNLLKSNCLVTGQPDWGTVEISYKGRQIDKEGLLKYIISFRNHNEFHEQCVERIFVDLYKKYSPKRLSVGARYTRRGGIDINPFRSTESDFFIENKRLIRQ